MTFAKPVSELGGRDPTGLAAQGKGLALNDERYIQEPARWSGQEITYVEKTSNTTISGTTDAGATTVLSTSSVEYDGKPILIEFFAPRVTPNDADAAWIAVTLWEDSTDLGRIWFASTVAAMNGAPAGVHAARRRSPSKGAHTYTVKAFRAVGDGTVEAGPGGAGDFVPAFIRITRAGTQTP